MKKILIFFAVIFSTNTFAFVNENVPNACGVSFPSNVHARFVPNTYTCNSGYFLPANSTTCVACPNGSTCSGGSFDFNPNSAQGIIYNTNINQNIPNSCSVAFPKDFKAKFVRNTINLNYDDGNGNITTTTCTYGDTITFP